VLPQDQDRDTCVSEGAGEEATPHRGQVHERTQAVSGEHERH
jgi:hypothetical protein